MFGTKRNPARKSRSPRRGFLTALLVSIGLVVGTVWLSSINDHIVPKAFVSYILPIGAVFTAILVIFTGNVYRPTKGLVHCNGDLEDRIRNNLLFFAQAKDEIVIVSGRLFAPVYDNPRMLELFDRLLRDGVELTVYLTSAARIDAEKFTTVLEKHGVEPISVPDARLRHGAVVDRRHVKLEKRETDDLAEHKDVTYYMFHRKMARKGLADIQNGLPISVSGELSRVA